MRNLRVRSLASCRAFRLLRLRFEGFGNLAHDGFCGFSRLRRLGNGPANDNVAGAGLDGVGGRSDTFLVAGAGAGRPDSWNHQDAFGTGERAQRAHLLRRADKSADAGSHAHARQQLGLFGGRAGYCDRIELFGIHTGEHSDCKQLRRVGHVFKSDAGCGEHRRAPKRVESNHARAVGGRRADGSSHRVGNVVKLKVEKDGMIAADEGFNDGWTGSGKELEADLEPMALPLEPVDEFERGNSGGHIQGHDEPSARFLQPLLGGKTRGRKTRVQPFRNGHNLIVMHRLVDAAKAAPQMIYRGFGRISGRPFLNEKAQRSPGLTKVGWVLVLVLLWAGRTALGEAVDTNPMNYDPQVQAAFASFHNLDFADATARFERYHHEHPGNPQATAYLLNAVVFQELYRLDLLDTTFYANDGFLSGKHATPEDPQVHARVLALTDEVVREANWRLSEDPKDVNALFARGWARSLECTYIAMVERGFRAGFGLATKAKDDETRVLAIDPNYEDAKLVVGVYQYVVGALPWPFKFFIGFAGITGSRTKGMQLLRDDGENGVITSVEARTVMALFLRREGKYKDAVTIVRGLEAEYPRNFLFRLEEANLRKDDGQGMAAVDAYREVIADAGRPGYFPAAKLELADFGLGEALRGQRHYQQAAQAYERAARTEDVGAELKIRSLVAGGQCRDMADQRRLAVGDYREAIEAGPNTSRADAARKYLHSPYRGT
jgi:tetratricopeptide (TPR) repeat protein